MNLHRRFGIALFIASACWMAIGLVTVAFGPALNTEISNGVFALITGFGGTMMTASALVHP